MNSTTIASPMSLPQRLLNRGLFLSACILMASQPLANSQDFISSAFTGNVQSAVVPLVVIGTKGTSWNASGFLVQLSSGSYDHRFLITARHVVESDNPNSEYGERLIIYLNRNLNEIDARSGVGPVYTQEIKISSSNDKNVGFPSDPTIDIAAVYLGSIGHQTQAKIAAASENYATGKSTSNQVWLDHVFLPLPDIIRSPFVNQDVLTEIFFVGFPFGTNGAEKISPIIRSGVVASSTTKGYLKNNYGPSAFMIDNGPVPGDSGGPIFSIQSKLHVNRIDTEVRLIGVTSREVGDDEGYSFQSRYHRKMEWDREKFNLGIGFPANFIMNAVEDLFR